METSEDENTRDVTKLTSPAPELSGEGTNDVFSGPEDAAEVVEGILTEEEPAEDILTIASKLLKQATKVNTHATLKNIMMLTAIVSYKKLHCAWKDTGAQHQKKPTKSASLAIAMHMGKGPIFAHKIQEMVPYVLKY